VYRPAVSQNCWGGVRSAEVLGVRASSNVQE
jgi:hypothetical protein